jgi:hypothetical protein
VFTTIRNSFKTFYSADPRVQLCVSSVVYAVPTVNILTSIKAPFQPRLTERDPERGKISTGLENVLVNTTGDMVEPGATFVVFKRQAQQGTSEDGTPVLKVSSLEQDGEELVVKEGWIPKEAFREVGEAYYLPTYRFSTTGALLGGGTRGLLSAGIPGAVAGIAGGLAASKVGDNSTVRAGVGIAAGALALTGFQLAVHGATGIPSALFAGSLAGIVAAGAGEGDSEVRDAMLGGTAMGLAATMATGLPMGMLTGSAATAIGAQAGSRTAQVLLSAGAGAALTTVQALISGNSPLLAASIGAAIGGLGSLIGPGIGQLGRNAQKAVEPWVAKGVGKALDGRGETTFQVASAIPQALAFGSLGASLGLVAPQLTPLGIALGAVAGGVHGFVRSGQRIDDLKELHQKRLAEVDQNPNPTASEALPLRYQEAA